MQMVVIEMKRASCEKCISDRTGNVVRKWIGSYIYVVSEPGLGQGHRSGQGGVILGPMFSFHLFYIWQSRKLMLIGSRNHAIWREIFLREAIISPEQLVSESVCCVPPVRPETKEWGSWNWLSECESLGPFSSVIPNIAGQRALCSPPIQTRDGCSAELWVRWRKQATELLIFKGM